MEPDNIRPEHAPNALMREEPPQHHEMARLFGMPSEKAMVPEEGLNLSSSTLIYKKFDAHPTWKHPKKYP